MHRLQELVHLYRLKTPVRKMAQLLNMSPNTERAYRNALQKSGLLQGEPDSLPSLELLKTAVSELYPNRRAPQNRSSVEPWSDKISKMLERGAGPKAIFDALRLEESEFEGSYFSIKRFCTRLKKKKGPNPQEIVIPVQTAPGQVAQVDFGYAGKLYDPQQQRERKVWFLVMTLGYSRHMFASLVFDQKAQTFLRLHIDAFEFFGGVPETIVPDNLKAAVIRNAFGSAQTEEKRAA